MENRPIDTTNTIKGVPLVSQTLNLIDIILTMANHSPFPDIGIRKTFPSPVQSVT